MAIHQRGGWGGGLSQHPPTILSADLVENPARGKGNLARSAAREIPASWTNR